MNPNQVMVRGLFVSLFEAGVDLEEEGCGHRPHDLHIGDHVRADQDDRDEEGGDDVDRGDLHPHNWAPLQILHAGRLLEATLLYLLPNTWDVILVFLKIVLKMKQ